MTLLPRLRLPVSRPRRAVRRVKAAVEMLEVRSLLSSTAVIQWSMLPQIVRDPSTATSPTCRTLRPMSIRPSGYGVLLDASHSMGILPTTTFSWTVTASSGQKTVVSGEDPTIDLQQGMYAVKLTATGMAGTNRPLFATTTIQVKDVLVVSIGDSYASGEGNPVVPGILYPQWAYSPDPAMNTENANAHRSTIAGPRVRTPAPGVQPARGSHVRLGGELRGVDPRRRARPDGEHRRLEL